MNTKLEKIQAIPTNIITGFLGVGKTTAILSLLANKPENERWAVLVNEFGEIGIDGSLLQGQHSENSGIFIREVPGGCMCCAAGLPMQIALNQLLTKAKPQRLLIEPTGLGHPKEILQVLSAEHYRTILDVQTTVTLVDARKVSDKRYTNHDTFNQQIQIADIIVGNKSDLYQSNEKEQLENYVKLQAGPDVQIVYTEQGQLNPSLLKGASKAAKRLIQSSSNHHQTLTSPEELTIPECGYLKSDNTGEGYRSSGWRISAEKIFQRQAIFNCFAGLNVERLKAVLITDEGVFGYNLVDDSLKEVVLDDCLESRIEIIWKEGEDSGAAEDFPFGLLME